MAKRQGNFKGGARERATLTFGEEWYTPANLLNGAIDMRDITREYSRLRSIARKRLERFEGTEWEDTQVYKQNKGFYVPVKELQSKYELAYKLSALARFMTAETSSVRGLETQRRKSIKSLHSSGYGFVSKQNFIKFGQFMDEYRAQKQDRIYDSKRAADTFGTLIKKGINPERIKNDFDLWLRNQEQLAKIDIKTKNGQKSYNSNAYRKELIKLEKRTK